MTLAEYVKKRNGVPIGHPHSLRNNLTRSLGAKNFRTFWNFWNPIFGYYLGTKIFKPMKRVFPPPLALVLTFVCCGLIHDLVTTAIRGKLSLFFSVWFLFMALAVVIAKYLDYDLSARPWFSRAALNLLIIWGCLLCTILLNSRLDFY